MALGAPSLQPPSRILAEQRATRAIQQATLQHTELRAGPPDGGSPGAPARLERKRSSRAWRSGAASIQLPRPHNGGARGHRAARDCVSPRAALQQADASRDAAAGCQTARAELPIIIIAGFPAPRHGAGRRQLAARVRWWRRTPAHRRTIVGLVACFLLLRTLYNESRPRPCLTTCSDLSVRRRQAASTTAPRLCPFALWGWLKRSRLSPRARAARRST